MNFGRFDCGCIGILSVCGMRVIMLKRCDEDDDLRFDQIHRVDDPDLKDRKFEPLSMEATDEIIRQLGDMVAYGYLYLDIRRLLEVPIRHPEDPRLF